MINAITIDNNIETGTATSTGMNKKNKGTATKDSPNPKVDLTKEATKLIKSMNRIVEVIGKTDMIQSCKLRLIMNDEQLLSNILDGNQKSQPHVLIRMAKILFSSGVNFFFSAIDQIIHHRHQIYSQC